MKVVFRTDSSVHIGAGHVMRCLTLADELRKRGVDCQFICREHSGNLIKNILRRGYVAHRLPLHSSCDMDLAHGRWLGASQEQDAKECIEILSKTRPELLIVDHYALDIKWESAIVSLRAKLMVIDDLADRNHKCDILLDQTLNRSSDAYAAYASFGVDFLCGVNYALLRPKFSTLREISLRRRKKPELRKILITLGGMDEKNATLEVMKSICNCLLPPELKVTVVMGSTAPHLFSVMEMSRTMTCVTEVRVDVADMAEVMAESDLAICAGGATVLESCCLGLPAIVLVLAQNQMTVAKELNQAGAVLLIKYGQSIGKSLRLLIEYFLEDPDRMSYYVSRSSSVVDGRGVTRVADILVNKC